MYSSKCRGGAGSAGVRDERTTNDAGGGQASTRRRPFPPTPRTRLHRRGFMALPAVWVSASEPARPRCRLLPCSRCRSGCAGAQVRGAEAPERDVPRGAVRRCSSPVDRNRSRWPDGEAAIIIVVYRIFFIRWQQSIARSNPLAAYKALNVRSKVRDRTKSGHPPPPAPKLPFVETCAAATRPTVSCELKFRDSKCLNQAMDSRFRGNDVISAGRVVFRLAVIPAKAGIHFGRRIPKLELRDAGCDTKL